MTSRLWSSRTFQGVCHVKWMCPCLRCDVTCRLWECGENDDCAGVSIRRAVGWGNMSSPSLCFLSLTLSLSHSVTFLSLLLLLLLSLLSPSLSLSFLQFFFCQTSFAVHWLESAVTVVATERALKNDFCVAACIHYRYIQYV